MSGPASALNVLADLAAKLIRQSRTRRWRTWKNIRAQFIAELANRGLVTREEYDTQVALLEKTRAKLAELESKDRHALEQSAASEQR